MSKICKLLLVEDQREIQDLLHELFAEEGYRLAIVGDGAEMRRVIEHDPAIDIVIIDVLLPGGVDGLTLAGEARARGLPVILVTGDHTQSEKLKACGHRYLLKPFALAAFVELIDLTLQESRVQCERDGDRRNHFGATAKPGAPDQPDMRQADVAVVALSEAAEIRSPWQRRVRQWLAAYRPDRRPRPSA
jgi:DNA-binding response OmpR family regulator